MKTFFLTLVGLLLLLIIYPIIIIALLSASPLIALVFIIACASDIFVGNIKKFK